MEKMTREGTDFAVSQVGEQTLAFTSKVHPVRKIIWSRSGKVEIIITDEVLGKVTGLCGFYNGKWNVD